MEQTTTNQAAPRPPEEGQPRVSGNRPLAVIAGEPCREVPGNLYIPPDALRVFLEQFEGPLDLLLHLIRRQNIDILDIPIAKISAQYMRYIELMRELKLELAGEYLVMAALLAEIKSRMLLPQSAVEEDAEADPRAELARRIAEYERYRQAAEDLDRLERMERDLFPATAEFPDRQSIHPPPVVVLEDLVRALTEVLERNRLLRPHYIQRETLSVRERMSELLTALAPDACREWRLLLRAEEGRAGVVVTLLALLELLRESLIEVVQNDAYGPIHIKSA
ncbi:MAG: segregation/condensation protein A [Gammaproteobacteria bacterium]|nr:segregation/condensation protein A [Gammaproteobacteria bacterium]